MHAGIPPGCGPGDPPGVGLETSPGCGPGDPPGVGPGDPLGVVPGQTSQLPLGCGLGDLQCMLGYHPRGSAWHAGIPPAMYAGIPTAQCTEFLTQPTENITLPQTSFAGSNERNCTEDACPLEPSLLTAQPAGRALTSE